MNQNSHCTWINNRGLATLIQENRGLRNPEAAIRREIDSIMRDLKHENRESFERSLLELTKTFYEALHRGCPSNLDELPEHAEVRLAEFHSRILGIHVTV